MSGFQRDEDQNQSSTSWWKIGLGIGAAVGVAWVAYEGYSYEKERLENNKTCENLFVSVEELIDSDELEDGDLIEIQRLGYQHWAVYVGKGRVVHVINNGKIKLDNLREVAAGHLCRLNRHMPAAIRRELEPRASREYIVSYALQQVGRTIAYDVKYNNCEHFATECFYGTGFSEQEINLDRNSTICGSARFGASSVQYE